MSTTTTKWLGIALAVSVAINLFAAGFLVSRALHRSHGRKADFGPSGERVDVSPFMGPRGLLGRVADARLAPRVREVMRAHGDELREGRGEMREQRRAVEDALRGEPFDADALDQALLGLRQSTLAAQERMHAALVDVAKTLPVEDRRALARHGRGRRARMPLNDGGTLDR
jgi:uncharacterized membrane protein